MPLKVVGAGLPRTGTLSLKTALERLLGHRCYHMAELFQHPEHASTWAEAFHGRFPDWDAFLAGYVATVDWPAARLWRELAAAYPDAVVLLSRRASAEQWWTSMDQTIFPRIRQARRSIDSEGAGHPPAGFTREHLAGLQRMFRDIGGGVEAVVDDQDAAMAYYEQHLAQVRDEVAGDRLVEWQTGEGWRPLCAALGMPEPDEPFPSVNSTQEFQTYFWADHTPDRR